MTANSGALFFDRDGVLNVLVQREGRMVSPRILADFVIVNEAGELVRRVERLGIPRFVVTNQPDIARGLMQPSELAAMHDQLRRQLPMTDIVYCPHDDSNACDCRKPKAGMLFALAKKWGLSLGHSIMIGDTARDMQAGRRAGCYTILLGTLETDASAADRRAADLSEAVELAVERLLQR